MGSSGNIGQGKADTMARVKGGNLHNLIYKT